jgi:hypothetical protein
MKFKVIELDWYAQFKQFIKIEGEEDFTEQEYHDFELEEYKKGEWDYDGPFRYIKECEDMPWPAREGVKYCVRLHEKPSCSYYRAYQCYCYQLGRWWKFKEVQFMFTEIHVPQFMSLYDYSKVKCPFRFLNKQAQIDRTYHLRQQELIKIGRDVSKSMLSFTKEWKAEQKLIKTPV